MPRKKKSKSKGERTLPFTIGCDPECNFYIGNQRVGANSLLTAIFGEEQSTYRGYNNDAGNLGVDAGDIGEFRPTYSRKPAEVVENMRQLLEILADKGRVIKASTKSEYKAVGGHIHFGLKEKGKELDALHRKVALYCLPIMLGEDAINTSKRINGGYGKIAGKDGGYRENSYGTYELRFLSAEWLTTPKLMNAVFCYLGVVINEIINNPTNFKKDTKALFSEIKIAEAMQTMVLTEYEPLADILMKDIRKKIKTFELYQNFRDEVDYVIDIKKVKKDKKAVDFDIMKGWGLVNTVAPGIKSMSEKKTNSLLKDLNTDKIKRLVPIFCNPDTNIPIFAEELTNKCLAHKWTPKYEYVLFGLRKGFTEPVICNAYEEIISAPDMVTISDMKAVKGIIKKITSNLGETRAIDSPEEARGILIIGLPYEMRIKKATTKFLEMIIKIEKTKTPEPKEGEELIIGIPENSLIDDKALAKKTTLSEEEKAQVGKIHLMMKNISAEQEITVTN